MVLPPAVGTVTSHRMDRWTLCSLHLDTEKKTPVFRASSWSQAGFLVMVECVDSSSIILSVTPVEEVSSRNPGCEVKQVPKGVRMGTCVDSLDIIDNI